MDHRLQVPPLPQVDLLPALGRQSDVLRAHQLLVVLVSLRTEPLEDGEGPLVPDPVTHLVGVHPKEEGVGQLGPDLFQADPRGPGCLYDHRVEHGVSDLKTSGEKELLAKLQQNYKIATKLQQNYNFGIS